MASFDFDSETKKRLARVAKDRGCSVAELVGSMLETMEAETQLRGEPLVDFTLSPEYRAKFSDADRYLSLLAWTAKNFASEFSDLIEHSDSGRRYLGMSPEEIQKTCRHNQARQIPGTHFWAIMNLDTSTKRRFLRRLLVFIGARDEVIEHVVSTLGKRSAA